jgi:predicted phosphoribosyltransferase/dienelactone hydrolase
VFADRTEAGIRLARAVQRLDPPDPVVLGLPRGGVIVAAAVARTLAAPLDVVVVRKLGAPGNPELGVGAIAEGGVTVLNEQLIAQLRVTSHELDDTAAAEHGELERRVAAYRAGRPTVPLEGRAAVVVDDGLATGYTARAAIEAARRRGAASVILAVPVAVPETVGALEEVADRVVVVEAPRYLMAVGAAYADFRQTTDAEVEAVLREFGSRRASPVVEIPAGGVLLEGDLEIPAGAAGMVVFAHGSGSSRLSPRNRAVAAGLRRAGLGTLLFDLLTADEGTDRHKVFDIPLLGERLLEATRWLQARTDAAGLPIGFFGASTGAAAALRAAAFAGDDIGAVVSRGGRPDLAGDALERVTAPTLLIVGEDDPAVLELNLAARARMTCESGLEIVPGATHLFEEPGALERVEALAVLWFRTHLEA